MIFVLFVKIMGFGFFIFVFWMWGFLGEIHKRSRVSLCSDWVGFCVLSCYNVKQNGLYRKSRLTFDHSN